MCEVAAAKGLDMAVMVSLKKMMTPFPLISVVLSFNSIFNLIITENFATTGFGVYPPPPEPAPPDFLPAHVQKGFYRSSHGTLFVHFLPSIVVPHPLTLVNLFPCNHLNNISTTYIHSGWVENNGHSKSRRGEGDEWLDNEVYQSYSTKDESRSKVS